MLAFIVATWIVTLIPGPSMILIMLNSIERGLAKGVQTAVGAVTADAILLIVTMSGLGPILSSSNTAFTAVKWGGVIYLIYLGSKIIASQASAKKGENPVERPAFLQGLGVTLLNPKIIGFFVAFFPQFLRPEQSIVGQLMVLGPVFLLNVLFLFLVFAFTARFISRFLESPRGQLVLKNVSGQALIGCGLFAATVERT